MADERQTKNSRKDARQADHRARFEEQVDELYRLPPTEFIAARNALAGRLKKGQHVEEAQQVKALIKPSLSAWAVNQLYWHHQKDFARLLTAGEEFRDAQTAQLEGKTADLRGSLDARRQALAALSRTADAVLREVQHAPTPEIMRRITTTLEALATYASLPGAPQAGRLVDDVDPPGFEALAALVPRVGRSDRDEGGPTRVLQFRQAKPARAAKRKPLSPEEQARQDEEERRARHAAAKAAVADAQKALREARAAGAKAEADLKKAAAKAKDAERERAKAQAALDRIAEEADRASREAHAVAAAAEEAAQAVADAEQALEAAQRSLQAAGNGE